MTEFLYTLLRTLNTISVRGKDDLSALWGCINAIENKIIELENQTEEVSEDER